MSISEAPLSALQHWLLAGSPRLPWLAITALRQSIYGMDYFAKCESLQDLKQALHIPLERLDCFQPDAEP